MTDLDPENCKRLMARVVEQAFVDLRSGHIIDTWDALKWSQDPDRVALWIGWQIGERNVTPGMVASRARTIAAERFECPEIQEDWTAAAPAILKMVGSSIAMNKRTRRRTEAEYDDLVRALDLCCELRGKRRQAVA